MRGHFDAFFNVTARWRLTHAEPRALLGSPTDERWFHFMYDTVPAITPAEFARIHAVIQIHEALSDHVNDPREAAPWIRTLEIAPPFVGRTPLALLFRRTEGCKAVADDVAVRRPAAHESALR
jgi:hypothetical protein